VITELPPRLDAQSSITCAPIDVHPPREDALPEHMDYRDEGCDLFASCLSCPLPRCRYDQPGGARSMINVVRDEEIRRIHRTTCLPIDEIAARFRVSRRTVFRVLQVARTREEHCQ